MSMQGNVHARGWTKVAAPAPNPSSKPALPLWPPTGDSGRRYLAYSGLGAITLRQEEEHNVVEVRPWVYGFRANLRHSDQTRSGPTGADRMGSTRHMHSAYNPRPLPLPAPKCLRLTASPPHRAPQVSFHDTARMRKRIPLLSDFFGFTCGSLGEKVG